MLKHFCVLVCVSCLYKEAFVDTDPGGRILLQGQDSALRV